MGMLRGWQRAWPWVICAALSAWIDLAAAQRLPKVAIVLNSPPAAKLSSIPPVAPNARAFFDGMKAWGWEHGRNVELVWRTAEQRPERIPAIIDDLVRMEVDVIVASGNLIARTAKDKTRTIPIVLGASEFVVEAGLVESYARPGGNVTGVSMMLAHLDAKRIGILKELAPNVSRVAVLGQLNPSNQVALGGQTGAALKALGMTGFHVRADRGEHIEGAFADAVRKGADAMVVSSTGPMHQPEIQAIIHALAIRHRVPVMYAVLTSVETGGLIAYTADELAIWRRSAHYVDRILRGEHPSRLPIEHPTAYQLHINRKAAAAIGLSVPPSILTQADKVFD